MKKIFEVSVGKQVCLVPTGNLARHSCEPILATIESIGRKYFYVKIDSAPHMGQIKFDRKCFDCHYDDNSGFNIYESYEAYAKHTLFEKKLAEIESVLQWCRFHNGIPNVDSKPSYDAVDRIYEILIEESGIQIDRNIFVPVVKK